jgi:putative redox protein
MKAHLKWEKGMKFKGKAETGVWVPIGPSKPETGNPDAASPMELVLLALAGCTSMDVVWILQKKKITLEDFWVDIEAERVEGHPKVYSAIHMKFVFTGKDLKIKALEQAVALSAEKYCSVGAMVGKVAKITHEIEIVGN